ncbi:MAG: N-acetyl-gamma-glutamyl-phosphate reductase [Thermoguttaceae bacterium]
MVQIAILGATGYTALELIKILLRHPGVELVALTSREDNRPVDLVHPSLTGRVDLRLENLAPEDVAKRAECVFSCLPHTASAKVVPTLLENGAKVVDFSADYRLDTATKFEEWYAEKHPDPSRLGCVPYGLPELFREQIREASLVANPGCYPTSAILPLTPLLKSGIIEPQGIILDSKSGVSGAGRKPKLTTLYTECNESISAYSVGTHRHLPEIDLILSRGSELHVETVFTPHLTPMDRGILTTAYSVPTEKYKGITQAELEALLHDFYDREPFVNVVSALPATKDVSGSNRCHIAVRVVRGKIVTVSVIDNLIKGASGAAAQNFNLMFGFPETTALL